MVVPRRPAPTRPGQDSSGAPEPRADRQRPSRIAAPSYENELPDYEFVAVTFTGSEAFVRALEREFEIAMLFATGWLNLLLSATGINSTRRKILLWL